MNKNNIAISLLQISHHSPTGVFVYVQSLLDNLLKIDKNNEYYLLLRLNDFRYFRKRYKNDKNIKLKIIDMRRDLLFNPVRACLKIIAGIKKDKSAKEEILRKEIQKLTDENNINIFFFPSGIIYPKNIKNTKKIVTICDLQYEYFPENFPGKYLKYRKESHRYAMLNSDRIIAISNYTRNTIIENNGISPEKITTIYLGTDAKKIKKGNILLPNNFIFYPAAVWPHKNHKILIDLLKKIEIQFPDLCLVFTGMIKNHGLKKEIDNLINNYNLSKKIIFLGYVSDDNLNCIYQNAKVLIYPSSFEGFGLPIIEAFKHKLPVIAADNTSIREIVEDAGLLFETNNLEMLADCVKKILTDQSLREHLINNGFERAKNFTWENTALKTLSLFNKL